MARESIAGVVIPDTRLADAVTDRTREIYASAPFHHARRIFLLGTLLGRVRGVVADPELLYAAAMLHDWEPTAPCASSDGRLQLGAADQVLNFLLAFGRPVADARRAWLAVALHSTSGSRLCPVPEAAVLAAGVEADVVGRGLRDLEPDQAEAVLAAHPRTGYPEYRSGSRPGAGHECHCASFEGDDMTEADMTGLIEECLRFVPAWRTDTRPRSVLSGTG